jgi:hypothetical protein
VVVAEQVSAVQPDLARFLELIRRELGASEANVFAPGDVPSPGDVEREVRFTLADGRVVVAVCDVPLAGSADRAAKERRLEMLSATFDAVVDSEPPPPRSRPPAARALHLELRALRERADAINALVTDANSPVLWAAARPHDVVPEALLASSPAAAGDPEGSSADPPPDEAASVADASRRVLLSVRGVIDVAALRRGRRIRHVEREGIAPFLVHSFAGIYLLTLLFARAFDELRAERAVIESLPRIERLVLALPPLDPTPQKGGGVVALRGARPRRRRDG